MINNITDREILPGLTTTLLSNWREKVREIKKFQIKKIALFPTAIGKKKRKELYKLLEESGVEEIPHVHVRNDMEEWEFELLENKYKTKFFNTHDSYFEKQNFKNHLDKMYLENNYHPIKESNLKECAGLCIDFSHLEATRRTHPEIFQEVTDQMQRYPINCCHISAIKNNRFHPFVIIHGYDNHYLRKMEEIEYVKDYVQYLPKYISLELENSFEEQLKIKARLEEIISNANEKL